MKELQRTTVAYPTNRRAQDKTASKPPSEDVRQTRIAQPGAIRRRRRACTTLPFGRHPSGFQF